MVRTEILVVLRRKTQVGDRSNRAIAAHVVMCSALKKEPGGSRASPERQRYTLSVDIDLHAEEAYVTRITKTAQYQ